MSERAEALARMLIRNFNDVPMERERREPLYDTDCARLARGTAARKLGASIDTVAAGMRSCPYHFHHAQEEMFVILEGQGTLRVRRRDARAPRRRHRVHPSGTRVSASDRQHSDAPLKYLSISTRDMPEVVEYPDSNKISRDGFAARRQILRLDATADNTLDYWDGEP
jgi:uncharacterized cupin superfamily protein